MASVRAELLAYLTHVLLGDGLAAEYLLLHLISNVCVCPPYTKGWFPKTQRELTPGLKQFSGRSPFENDFLTQDEA